ncbi:unnamed protein product [Candidula unifasciata]|uniref:PWWP domain-containing protein n=1 Tax=Candidula unifasciata TaxID=100452 RepID=A0A8S3YYY1_9EUPU|nr:unnamed protein product [Candidula unifasciata]
MAADTCSSQPIETASSVAAKRQAREVSRPQSLSPSKRINTRCVMLHPTRMPPLSHLRSLVLSDSSSSHKETDDSRWPEGQLLWGKIRGYPFWPCMVSRDPFSKLFTKTLGKSVAVSHRSWKTSRSYHVQFFGKETEHSWINEASLLEFEGRHKYLDIVQYGLENPQRNSRPPGEFVISPAWYPSWSLAVTEAEAASKLGLEQRKLCYTFDYVVTRGEAQKPVDELLKVIWFHSGGRQGDGEDKPDIDDDDDDSLYNKLFGVRRENACYDSDDFYSSDESSSSTADRPPKPPVRVQVRPGLLQVYLHKQGPFLQERHPDWDPSFVEEYLKKQWSVMSSLQRSRYTTRHQKPLFVEVYRSQRSVSPTVDDLPPVDPLTLGLQIQKLSRKWHIPRSEKSGMVCRQPGADLVRCQGPCAGYFHSTCLQDVRNDASLCPECHLNATVCFACKQPGADLVQCSSLKCHKFYHEVCVAQLPLTVMDPAGFLCPLHVCVTCQVEQRPLAREGMSTRSFVECLRCPTAYHCSDWCLIAGSQLTGRHHLLCADHFQPTRGCSQHSRVHLRACLKCGLGKRFLYYVYVCV